MVAVWHAPALALVALLGVAANAASSQARTSSHKNHSAEALRLLLLAVCSVSS